MELQELEKLTVTKLREMAAEYEDVKGASGMTKEQLLVVLCEKLGIDREIHRHVKEGTDKTALKKTIRELKGRRAQALASGDKAAANTLRRRVHHTKRRIRKSIEVDA